jgi:hypothetical protein
MEYSNSDGNATSELSSSSDDAPAGGSSAVESGPRRVDLNALVTVSKASGLKSRQWGSHELALHALLDEVSKLQAGKKGAGAVWAPATLVGEKRAASQVLYTDLIVFDSDAGHALAEIKARFESVGWYARIIPSSSWGTTETEASADHYNAWVAGQSTADDLAERYLVEQKHKIPAVASGPRSSTASQSRRGTSRAINRSSAWSASSISRARNTGLSASWLPAAI